MDQKATKLARFSFTMQTKNKKHMFDSHFQHEFPHISHGPVMKALACFSLSQQIPLNFITFDMKCSLPKDFNLSVSWHACFPDSHPTSAKVPRAKKKCAASACQQGGLLLAPVSSRRFCAQTAGRPPDRCECFCVESDGELCCSGVELGVSSRARLCLVQASSDTESSPRFFGLQRGTSSSNQTRQRCLIVHGKGGKVGARVDMNAS